MAVGPSQAPMIPMESDSSCEYHNSSASNSVKKIPNCPAAPSRRILGFSSSGEKSVIAPIPMKIRMGNSSVMIPMLYSVRRNPPSSITAASGIFTKIVPNPMGTNRRGSSPLPIPRYRRRHPIRIISRCDRVSWVTPPRRLSRPDSTDGHSKAIFSLSVPLRLMFRFEWKEFLERGDEKAQHPKAQERAAHADNRQGQTECPHLIHGNRFRSSAKLVSINQTTPVWRILLFPSLGHGI